jgi:hypothetical protein
MDAKILGTSIYISGQEGQGRPADIFSRRFVEAGRGNPYRFECMACSPYLDEAFGLPACPNDAGEEPSTKYTCRRWATSPTAEMPANAGASVQHTQTGSRHSKRGKI